MFEIGSSLREARTRRGLSPADVHRAIRIRERYLTALEEERWDMLPGDAYTKGFLRTYAEFLGLRGRLYVDEFNAQVGQREEAPLVPETLHIRRPGDGGGVVRAAAAIVLVGAAAGGVVVWHHTGTPARPAVAAAAAAPKAHTATASRTTKPAVAPKPTSTVIRAARDESWLSIRIGGPSGREVFRGTLARGRVLRLGLRRGIWVRMGRPLALDIRIGKTLVTGLPSAPANVLLTPRGARR